MPDASPTKFCAECNYPLEKLRDSRCPECGRLFDPKDPSSFRGTQSYPVKLYACRDAMEAHFLSGLLAQANISSTVLGESLGPARGELPMTLETLPAVWIGAYHQEAALEVVKQFLEIKRGDALAVGEPWTCAQCGEQIEGQFSSCWNCQGDKATEADKEKG